VAEWARKNGLLKDKEDLPGSMTQNEYFTWKRGNKEQEEAKLFMDNYELSYEWLPTCNAWGSYSSPQQLMEALLYSPVQLCVDGDYQFDKDGYVSFQTKWSHAVTLIGYCKDKYWIIYDSETPQLLNFAWNYKFGYPMIHLITSKNMKLIKKKDSPAIYALDPEEKKLVPFAGGCVPGGRVFKTIYGTTDYSLLPIEVVKELPYPVSTWSITSQPFNS
jgi:hypothetical protein